MELPPLISIVIEPKTRADGEKLRVGVETLMAADPAVRVLSAERSGQLTVAGIGELHLEIIIDRVVPRRRFIAHGIQDRRGDGVPRCCKEGCARRAGADDARRGPRSRTVRGRGRRQLGRPTWTNSVAARSRWNGNRPGPRPAVDLFGYRADLQSRTRGLATYSSAFDRYELRSDDRSDDDRASHRVAPRRPAPRPIDSTIAVPEPDEAEPSG